MNKEDNNKSFYSYKTVGLYFTNNMAVEDKKNW